MFGSLSNFESLFDQGLFDRMRQVERELDAAFGSGGPAAGIRSVARGTFPPINVGATPDTVEVYLFAPGLDPKSVDVTLQQNLLTVSGARRLESKEGASYYRRERFGGEFRRVVTLPDDVDPDRVEAKYRDGVLQVSVRRRESAKPRQIEIK